MGYAVALVLYGPPAEKVRAAVAAARCGALELLTSPHISMATIRYLHGQRFLGEHEITRVDVVRFRPVFRVASFELVGSARPGFA